MSNAIRGPPSRQFQIIHGAVSKRTKGGPLQGLADLARLRGFESHPRLFA